MGDERTQAAHHREELAWAAGLWDGEGSCGYYGQRSDGRKRSASQWNLRVTVNQNHDPEVLHRFCAAVGIGKVYGPYSHPTGGERFSFQVGGAKAAAVLDAIMPWISGPKRRQAEAALEKWHGRDLRKGGHVCAPDCTCGRQKWKTQDLDPAIARRREQQREATRRYRAKKKEEA